jgi:transposase
MASKERRDFEGLEQRRKEAGELFAQGESQAWVARRLKVSRQSVSRWYQQWRKGGAEQLSGAGRAGRKPRLDAEQLRKVDAALRQGARQHGFDAELWSLPRVAAVIERVTGETFHPGHVWKILGALDWSVQKPSRQARERNADQVAYWVQQRWPEIKKTLVASTPGSSSRTNRGSASNRRSAQRGHRADKRRS